MKHTSLSLVSVQPILLPIKYLYSRLVMKEYHEKNIIEYCEEVKSQNGYLNLAYFVEDSEVFLSIHLSVKISLLTRLMKGHHFQILG